MLHSGGRHPPQAGAELKILIFGAGGSSIRPLGTIRGEGNVCVKESKTVEGATTTAAVELL